MMRYLIIASLALLFSTKAFSKFYVWTEGMITLGSSADESDLGSDVSSFGYTYQLHMAYMTPSGFYFGGLMTGVSTSTTTESPGISTESTTSMSFLGPSFGYFTQNGFYILGTYFLSASQEVGSTVNTVSEGMAYQGQIGLMSKLSGGLKLTTSIVYRTYRWDTAAGVDITNKTTTSGIQPYIGLIFKF